MSKPLVDSFGFVVIYEFNQLTIFPPSGKNANSAQDDLDKLAEVADIIHSKAESRDEFLEECRSGAFDGVKAIYRTWGSAKFTGLFDEELVNALPESIKFISHNGASPGPVPPFPMETLM